MWHHLNGARFELSVVPRAPLGYNDCVSEVQAFGYGIGPDVCRNADGRPSYHAVVRNVGGRGAWVLDCTIDALDQGSKPIPGFTSIEVPMGLAEGGVGARPHLAPGESASLDWFLPNTPPSSIGSYEGSCSLIVYRNPPI